jgi:ribulose-phosphate 3-epimerase
MNEIEIIPAILPKDFHELEDKVSYISGNADTVQIDICDGQFVQNATWPYRKNDDSFGMLLKEEIGLPAWENLNYEIDLMVNHPEEVIEDWIIAGANRIILHEESDGSIQGAIEAIDNRVEVGLAFNIDSEIVFREGVSSIQLMGIDRIGFQGQEYDPRVLEKIKEARMIYPDLPISVDGAVSLKNAEALINAGADRLVVGSAIFNTDNILESLEQFHEIVEG